MNGTTSHGWQPAASSHARRAASQATSASHGGSSRRAAELGTNHSLAEAMRRVRRDAADDPLQQATAMSLVTLGAV